MRRSLFLAAFLSFSLLASPLLAWHEVGHMLTTLIAYKQLSPGDTPSPAVKKLVGFSSITRVSGKTSPLRCPRD